MKDGVKKLEVYSVVAGRVRNALSDGELEEASDAVEVGVHPCNLGERLCIDGALERSPDKASTKHL
ncbi:MAG: hypothetical protein WBM46_05640, partial [Polyangiales bacterium]